MNASSAIVALSAAFHGWTFDPLVVGGIGALGAAYAIGVRRLWRPGRSARWSSPGAPWRAVSFAAGLAAIVAAVLSPLDERSAELLSAHMVQHLLLVVVAAPLLVLGAPAVPLLLALPVRWRRRVHTLGARAPITALRRALTNPLVVWSLHVAALWSWHVPSLYDAAVRNDALHALEHASFFGTAVLFWWVVFDPAGRRRLGTGRDILYVFTAGLQSAALGALFTFAATPLYPPYASVAHRIGVSALRDQQVAGLVMWIPAGVVYLGAAAGLFVRWLRAVEAETTRNERRGQEQQGGVPIRVAP